MGALYGSTVWCLRQSYEVRVLIIPILQLKDSDTERLSHLLKISQYNFKPALKAKQSDSH